MTVSISCEISREPPRNAVPTRLIMAADRGGIFILSEESPIPAAKQSSDSAADISRTFIIGSFLSLVGPFILCRFGRQGEWEIWRVESEIIV